jgi:hypothetical protein
MRTPAGASGVEAVGAVATGNDPGSTSKSLEACFEDLEQACFELAREREAAARLAVEPEVTQPALREPLPDSRDEKRGRKGRRRERVTSFDAGALQAIGFSTDDIEWIRGRWEDAELEKRYLADLEARGEDPPPGGELSDIERELRQDLRDNGYDAMLYATQQSNRVEIQRVRDGSIADRAGLRAGTVLWSYDGQRVFDWKEVAALSTSGKRGEPVEIEIITDDGIEKLLVERSPLGADLVSANQQPEPN